MNYTNEINIFLKELSKIYIENPNFEITKDTIYSQLKIFNMEENNIKKIPSTSISLETIQSNNFKRYQYSANCYYFNNYFWAFENRENKNDKEYYDKIDNAIKLYISIDENNLEYISQKLFDFILENKIISQGKISKFLRTDALVIRVEKLEDAKKICDYINSINYISKYKVNPFLIREGKVGIAKDGDLSYNSTISQILVEYFKKRRYTNKLEEVNYEDFKNFINKEFDYSSKNVMTLFNLKSQKEYNDYLTIFDILKSHINQIANLDMFEKYNINNREKKQNINNIKQSNKILDITKLMLNYYQLEDIYKIYKNFIETGEYNVFTRKNNIRTTIVYNYTQESFKKELENNIWDLFINAFKQTYNKYGIEQANYAVNKIINENSFNAITNDYNLRTILNEIVSINYLKKIIRDKLLENGFIFSNENLNRIIFNELNLDTNISTIKL